MRLLRRILTGSALGELEDSIGRLRLLRDSYRSMNEEMSQEYAGRVACE
jgi:hypothetical protein